MCLLISGVANFEPPCEFLARRKQGRRHRQVRPVAPTGGRLDRDVVVSAQVAIADPHPDIWRDLLVPSNHNRRPRLPLQTCAVCQTPSQKYLPTCPCLRSRHRAPNMYLHVRLIAKQGMGAPIRKQRLRPDIPVRVAQPHRVLAELDATPQPPWQHSARALERGIVEHRPRQAPRLSVVWQFDPLERSRPRVAGRIDARHHLVPPSCPGGDESSLGRIVNSNALIEQFLAGEAKRNDPASVLGLDLHLPGTAQQLHSASDRSV